MSKGHIDAAARGAFLSFTVTNATALIEKMVSNQSWGGGRINNQKVCIPWRRWICSPQKWTYYWKDRTRGPMKKKLWRPPCRPQNRKWLAKSVVRLDIRGTTAPKPKKMLRISTMGSDKIIMGGIINPAHKEVIRISTPTIIQINRPWKS